MTLDEFERKWEPRVPKDEFKELMRDVDDIYDLGKEVGTNAEYDYWIMKGAQDF